MARLEKDSSWIGETDLWAKIAVSAIAVLTIVAATQAQAQTFTALHTFTAGGDGAHPGSLSMDRSGNLYGVANAGGYRGGTCSALGCGTVFKLSRQGSNWVLNPLYAFHGGNDGRVPGANVVFGPDGSLYSTTSEGGAQGYGTVFKLQPPARACESAFCPWTKTELYQFVGVPNGSDPVGTLVFDAAGNIYGVTQVGGHQDYGTVYELTHSAGGWMESVLFSGLASPMSGVIFDHAGNLYGTTLQGGGIGYGSVYQLAPSGSGWNMNVLTSFEDDGDGIEPSGGLILDVSGNLYGGTYNGGSYNGGVVYELTPSGDNWLLNNLYSFGPGLFGPIGSLTTDASGNLYGATNDEGAYGYGNVFKLTSSNGGWSYTDLYDFTGGSDGAYPTGSLILDGNGNVFGTTWSGGSQQCECGVVWQITPP